MDGPQQNRLWVVYSSVFEFNSSTTSCLAHASSLFCSSTDTNNPLHYYNHDTIKTSDGMLNIVTDTKAKTFQIFDEDKKKQIGSNATTRFMRTGMLQSWNKFCFIGGVAEFSVKLPGKSNVGGLWPAGK